MADFYPKLDKSSVRDPIVFDAMADDLDAVMAWMDSAGNFLGKFVDDQERTLLHWAALKGANKVSLYGSHFLTVQDCVGLNVLHYAAIGGNAEFVRQLPANRIHAAFVSKDGNNETPLWHALNAGHADTALALCEKRIVLEEQEVYQILHALKSGAFPASVNGVLPVLEKMRAEARLVDLIYHGKSLHAIRQHVEKNNIEDFNFEHVAYGPPLQAAISNPAAVQNPALLEYLVHRGASFEWWKEQVFSSVPFAYDYMNQGRFRPEVFFMLVDLGMPIYSSDIDLRMYGRCLIEISHNNSRSIRRMITAIQEVQHVRQQDAGAKFYKPHIKTRGKAPMFSTDFDDAAGEDPFRMIDTGKVDQLRQWIEAEGNIDITKADGETLLMRAIRRNSREAFDLLMAAGCDVHDTDAQNMNALHIAAWLGRDWPVKPLIDATISLSEDDAKGCRPIDYVFNTSNLLMLKAFLDTGYAPATRDTNNALSEECLEVYRPVFMRVKLMQSIVKLESSEKIQSWINFCDTVNFFDDFYNTPLNQALADVEMEALLKKGADPNYFKDEYPLVSQMFDGNEENFKRLVDAGGDLNYVETTGHMKGCSLEDRARKLGLTDFAERIPQWRVAQNKAEIARLAPEIRNPTRTVVMPKVKR